MGACATTLLMFVGAWQESRAALNFGAPFRTYEVGGLPRSVAVGDLDGDGRPDLAVANQGSESLSLLLNIGNGSFDAPRSLAVGARSTAIAIADLNRDGRLDLVVAHGEIDSISVLLGLGVGNFASPLRYATGSVPRALAIGDLDHDGRLDLVVANEGAQTVSVLLADSLSEGRFTPRIDVDVGCAPAAVAIGDLNRDGWLDLVAATHTCGADTATVSVLLRQDCGLRDSCAFALTRYATGLLPPRVPHGAAQSVAIEDLDRDGDLDLALVGSMPGAVTVLRNSGSGRFDPPLNLTAGSGPIAVAAADLNADAKVDLAVANSSSSSVSVFLGGENATFAQESEFPTGTGPKCIAVADLNLDGRLDLVLANGTRSVSVLLGDGTGNFGRQNSFATGHGPTAVAMGDLDANGLPDLAVADQATNTVSVLLGTGEGRFGFRQVIPVGEAPSSVALGDLDRDGKTDLVVANSASNSLSVLLGNGDGSFGQRSDLRVGRRPTCVAAGDLDWDGWLDLVVCTASDDSVAVLHNRRDGTFQAPVTFATGRSPNWVAIGDLDRDGWPDLAVACVGADAISIFRNRRELQNLFGTRTDISAGIGPVAVTISDIDRDGSPDLAVANGGTVSFPSQAVSVLFGDGTGGFAAPLGLRTGVRPSSIAVADLDLDARADLVVAEAGDNTISVLRGIGARRFEPKLTLGTGDRPQALLVGDVNRDGHPDLVSANQGSSTVTALLNGDPLRVLVVTDLAAQLDGRTVRLTWSLSPQAREALVGIGVERAETTEGHFAQRTTSLLSPSHAMVFEDPDVASDHEYWYRLMLHSRDGGLTIAGPIGVRSTIGPGSRTTLHQPYEPAGGGPVQIRYSLSAEQTPVRLAIYDVRGRRVWDSGVRVLGPGEHTQTWDRRDAARNRVPRGIYFVHFEAQTTVATRKFAILHE